MSLHALRNTFLPELGVPKKGKVRDIYETEHSLALIASDRISVFDRVLEDPILGKGRVLTGLSRFWFDKTCDIIPNHILDFPDPNVMIVKKCRPIKLEMIVRGFLVGSLWRDYQKGSRIKCGVKLPEGLRQNDPLPAPIVTPTTKSENGHDEDIVPEEAIAKGIVTKEQWKALETASLKLFKRGSELLKTKGLILLDTKYEFGIDAEGHLTLIDEVHTPDSSRFWFEKDLAKKEFRFPDKEFAREWALSRGFMGEGPSPAIPEDVQKKIRAGYKEVYETITGEKLPEESSHVKARVLQNLKKAKLIKGVFALILAGSDKDQPHIDKITQGLQAQHIPFKTIIGSAHKNPKQVLEIIDAYNESLEPLVCITVAGRSNALSGVVAANLKWPVIACPPFKDHADYLTNIHSSLQMPSHVPAMTVIDPQNAALAAARILNAMELTA